MFFLDACSRPSDRTYATNISPPISRLPLELLARIFLLTARESPSYASRHYRGSLTEQPQEDIHYELGWIETIPRVCRLWKDVAFASSHLWCHFDFRFSDEWITTTLSRAKMSPINIVITHGCNITMQHVALLTAHLPHTRTLQLTHEELLRRFRICFRP
ncbi:hypothetical protein FA95DRAFT_403879 [Auriscalpium vulgare]|uniref:Uncharacterized protein n=1 Tax=Auriscalpium vulgare TaxID=40419 RepID=A0ACB8RH36_9AGAM|nr:hypothetical protein FA95DRAFT_403879 [Auriscalpium vulgare]